MAFHKLSPAQFNTGWVLCQLGRAYYEMVDYPAAANVFEFARQADRHRLEVGVTFLQPDSSLMRTLLTSARTSVTSVIARACLGLLSYLPQSLYRVFT